ncbi:uncharacterized protein [Agelaius tricolor]|uniref:uncharacterized protein isoform X2 n=1 Tax=Agelaius tricolor TaxID=9191 RepID=UPI0039F18263
MRMRMRMKMRLAFLLLMAAASCLSQTRHDPGEDSRQNSRDSSRDSRRDSRDSSRDSPRNSTRDSRRDLRDSPQDSPRDSPQDSPRGSPRGSRRGSGTAAAPRLLPAPLLLRLPPEPGPPRIRCLAPRRFAGSTFELLRGLPAVPVRSLPAAPDRHWAEFALPGAAGCFRCRYRSHNGSAWLESELSPGTGGSDLGDAECQPSTGIAAAPAPTAETPWNGTGTLQNGTGTLQNDPPWVLPVSVGVAFPGLLLLLGAATAARRGVRRRRGQSPTVPAPVRPDPRDPKSGPDPSVPPRDPQNSHPRPSCPGRASPWPPRRRRRPREGSR